MSVELNISELSDEQINEISNCLTIFPFNKRNEMMQKRGLALQSKPKNSIQMFVTEAERNIVKVPYKFGCYLMDKKMNIDLPHKKIIDLEVDEFGIDLRDYQIPMIEQAMKHLKKYRTTTLGLPPATGKTVLGIYLVYILTLSSMIFFDRAEIGLGWYETIKMCLPHLIDKVWFVGNSPVPDEMPAIILCMNKRWDKIPSEFLRQVGTLIVDEAHVFCSPGNIGCLLCTQPKYVILESATLHREDKLEKMVQLIVGEHGIFQVSERPYIIYKIHTDVKVQEYKNTQGLDSSRLYSDLSMNEHRNSIIMDILETNSHKKFITLSKVKEHINELDRLAIEKEIEHDTLFGSKSKYSDSFALFGTYSKIGKGFDEAKACKNYKGRPTDVVILCHSTPQWQIFEQARGRGMRYKATKEVPLIVVWLQDGNQMVKNHWKELEKTHKWFEKTNAQIIEVKHYEFGSLVFPGEKNESQRTKTLKFI